MLFQIALPWDLKRAGYNRILAMLRRYRSLKIALGPFVSTEAVRDDPVYVRLTLAQTYFDLTALFLRD